MQFQGFTKKQEEVWKRDLARLTILEGAVRAGKTVLTYFYIPWMIGTKNGRGIIMGKTLGTIEENILKPMRELYGDYVSEVKGDAMGNRYVNIFGVSVRCVGANDKSSEGKIRGATYGWAVCDEVSLYPENVFNMLYSRLSEEGAVCICTTNPDNPSHWLKKKWIDNKDIDVVTHKFVIDDNDYLSHEFVDNLKKGYLASPELYDRYILGLWASGEGAIYKKFIAEENAYVVETFDKNEIIDYNIGIDFGESKSATTFVLSGVTRGCNNLVFLEESHITKHGDTALLQEQFLEFLDKCYKNGWKPTKAFYDNAQDTLGQSIRSACMMKGLPIVVEPCIKDRIKERIEQEQVLFGTYRIKILKRCEYLIKAFKEAQWDDKEERLDIVGADNPIDMLDSAEYSYQKHAKNLIDVALYSRRV